MEGTRCDADRSRGPQPPALRLDNSMIIGRSTSMSPTPIVVTGLGATTPLGGDVASTWEGLLAGRSGISRIEADWAADLPVQIAGSAAVDPTTVLERVEARRLDRSAQLGVVAAMEGWRDAGFGLKEENPVDRERLGVVIATGIGGLQTLMGQWDVQLAKGPRRVSPLAIPMLMANATAGNVSLRLGAQAGAHAPVSACASSNEAIAYGIDMIRLGRADVVVVGGTEGVIHPLPIACFAQMQAMSRRTALGDTPQSLRTLASRLADAGWTVSAPLLPGHGRTLAQFSGSGASEWSNAAGKAYDELARQHQIVVVCGQSMGALLAIELAARLPLSRCLLAPYIAMPRLARAVAAGWAVFQAVYPIMKTGTGARFRIQ